MAVSTISCILSVATYVQDIEQDRVLHIMQRKDKLVAGSEDRNGAEKEAGR